MNNKELYIVTPWFNTFSGGAEVAARTLAEECVKRGIQVTVLTTCCKTPYDNWWKDSIGTGEENINGVRVKRFSLNNYGRDKYESTVVKQISKEPLSNEDQLNFYKYGISSDALCKYIQDIPVGIPIVMLPYFQALAYNVITQNPNRVSIIPCFHDEPQFYWEQVAEMIKYSHKIFYLSEPEKDMTIKQYGLMYGRKVIEAEVLGLGVEIPKHILNNLEVTNKELDLPDEYVVYVGRKDVGKGVFELVENHKLSNTNIPLVFMGGGDENLVPKGDNRFIDLGFVEEKKKYQIIKNATALINLSQNESFSLVIMEAWLMNVPVIVSNKCKVTTYHCQKSNGGFWINNKEDYQKVLDYILKNRHQVKTIASQGRAYVEANYNWNNVIYNLFLNYN